VRWVGALGLAMIRWSNEIPPPFVALLAAAYLWLRGCSTGASHSTTRTSGARSPPAAWGWHSPGRGGGRERPVAGERQPPDFPLLCRGHGCPGALRPGAGNRSVKEGGTRLGFNRYWMVSVVSVTAGLLGLGLALSRADHPGDDSPVLELDVPPS